MKYQIASLLNEIKYMIYTSLTEQFSGTQNISLQPPHSVHYCVPADHHLVFTTLSLCQPVFVEFIRHIQATNTIISGNNNTFLPQPLPPLGGHWYYHDDAIVGNGASYARQVIATTITRGTTHSGDVCYYDNEQVLT